MVTCPKLNQARAPPSNTLEELEELHKLSDKFTNFPGSLYGSMWMSVSDTEEEGVWKDYYTGEEAEQDVLKIQDGGLKENTLQNCGIVA